MKTSSRFRIYRDARKRLGTAYPLAFPPKGKRPPLKVGVIREIAGDGSHGLTVRKVRVFLSIWTRSSAYLEAVAREGTRRGLDGSPAGTVDPAHAADAARVLAERRGRKAAGAMDSRRGR